MRLGQKIPGVSSFYGILLGVVYVYTVSSAPIENSALSNSSSSTQGNSVMYSYSEAVVGPQGKPTVSQLTIVKGKDGDFHYAKTSNGNTQEGKWEGPLPTTPDTGNGSVADLNHSMESLEDELAPLKILQESIGSTLQDFLLKSLKF